MFNLVDLILVKDSSLKRETIDRVLSQASDVIIEALDEGKIVGWSGLGTFTWKKKATSKKKAEEWKEFPYLAEGNKVRFVPEQDGIKISGGINSKKRTLETS